MIYQGRILRPDGSPLEGNIDFLVKIYSPAPSKCLLWAERQTLSMHGSMGAFSLDIGKPAHRLNGAEGGGGTSFSQVFINHPGLTINSTQCNTGHSSYTPGATDERTISVSFSDAGREIRVVDLPVKSVPFAMQAEQISGYSVNSLFKIAGTAQPGDKPSSLFAKDGVDLLWEIAHNQDLQGLRLKNLGEPVVNSDAATKNYVDSLISQGSLGVITDVTGDVNILIAASGTTRALSLGTTGVTAGVYGAVGPSGGSTGVSVPVLTVDMWGRITSASQEPLPLATTGGGFGLITVDASSGLTLNSGTLGLNLSSLSGANFSAQAQNVVLAGPLNGGTGAVSFRALDEADVPQLASTGKVQNSATSATPALTNDAIIARDAVGGFKASGAFLNYLALDNGLQAGTSSAILLSAPAAASYSLVFPGAAPQNGDLLSFNSSGQMSWVQPGAAGLTSLALSVPAAEMSVSSPIGPGDGTLSLSWKNQNAGLVFAAPTGASGQPSFRQLAASDIATGTFGSAQIPNLDAAKVTSGTFDLARIPDLDAAKVTTGTFDLARIPDLGAAKITSGTFDLARIPDLDAAKVTTGTFDLARIPDFSAAKITSGTLPASRGGTGLAPQVSDANRLYGVNAAGSNSEFKTLVAGSGITISNSAGSINISAPGSGTLGWSQGGNSFGQTGTLGTNDNQALALKTNGSIRVAITNDGKVGIGTTAPGQKLEVAGNLAFSAGANRRITQNAGYIEFVDRVSGKSGSINITNDTQGIDVDGGDIIIQNQGGGRLGTVGKIGIYGTPGALYQGGQIEIVAGNGSSASGGDISIAGGARTGAINGGIFNRGGNVTLTGGEIGEFATSKRIGGGVILRPGINTLDGAFNGNISFQFHDGTNYVDGMVVRGSTGNVGIGTTAPGAKLSVQQNVGTSVPNDTVTIHTVSSTGAGNAGNSTLKLSYHNGSNSQSTRIGIGDLTYGYPDNGFIQLGGGNIWSSPQGMMKFSDSTLTTPNGLTYAGFEFYNNRSDNQDAFTFHAAKTTGGGTTFKISSAKTTSNGSYKVFSAVSAGGANFNVMDGGNVGIGTVDPKQKLEINGGMRLNTVTAKPACDATTRGTFWFTQGGAGVQDSVEVCAKDAGNAYAWRTLY